MNCLIKKTEIGCLTILYKVLSSSSFNILMLLIGFLIGIVSIQMHYQYISIKNSNNDFIYRIEDKMDEFDRLDEEYEVLQRDIRNLMKEAKIKITKDQENDNLSIP